jgi:hypothetical protein
MKDIALHPLYLAEFAYSLHSSLIVSNYDLCTLKDIITYQIHEMQWIDMTPLPSSLVARTMSHVNRGLLNLFEPIISLVL